MMNQSGEELPRKAGMISMMIEMFDEDNSSGLNFEFVNMMDNDEITWEMMMATWIQR